MAKKLQQFYIFKLNSSRVIQDKLNIQLNIDRARENGELVAIGDSQMLRSLREITGRNNYEERLKKLLDQRHNARRKPDSSINLYEIEKEIDAILFVPEIVSLVVEDNRHYTKIIENGLYINGKKYVRLMCSAGQARRNNVLLVDSDIEADLKKILNNGRKDIPLVPAKFNAYFALASSTALPVTTPLFCVVKDCEVKRKERVEWIEEDPSGDDKIEETEKEIKFNLFDGQGLISPRMAMQWAADLDLDYIPSCFIVRSNFIKGLLVVVDFVEYSDYIGKHIIEDVYGDKVNIRDMDVILSASQFKLYNAFDNIKSYIENCKKNNIGWGVTRYAPKQEKNHVTLNYQFIQALNLNDQGIKSLCKKTIEYFRNIISNTLDYTLLYLLGDLCDENYDEHIFERIGDNVAKAIILNNNLINDPYIQGYIQNSIRKRIKESYIGNIIVNGNYTFMAADPIAMLEHIFGMPVKGLLERGEYYCKYWLDRGINKIAGMRSPLVWRSEVNVMNLKTNDDIKHWFKYLNCCCVFPANGMDMAVLGGADYDGDIICLTDQKDIINGAYGGLPIMYETKKAPECNIVESELYKADMNGFNTKVGFLTNLSTTMYAMLPMFEENSKEYKEIIRRLKQCRKEQGAIIDATKGLVIRSIPSHWTNWSKITEDMSEEEREIAEFNNRIIVSKRPKFMVDVYSNYSKEYKRYRENYDTYSQAKFCLFLDELLSLEESELTKDQKAFIDQFNRYNPLVETNCITNNISNYMQGKIKEIKGLGRSRSKEFNAKILKDRNFEIDKDKLDKLYVLYKKYKSGRRNFDSIKDIDGERRFKTIEQYCKYIRQEALLISSNIKELASLAVVICYELHPNDNKSFAWLVFGDGIIENIKANKQKDIEIPFLDENGSISYLGKKYSKRKIYITDNYIDDWAM